MTERTLACVCPGPCVSVSVPCAYVSVIMHDCTDSLHFHSPRIPHFSISYPPPVDPFTQIKELTGLTKFTGGIRHSCMAFCLVFFFFKSVGNWGGGKSRPSRLPPSSLGFAVFPTSPRRSFSPVAGAPAPDPSPSSQLPRRT